MCPSLSSRESHLVSLYNAAIETSLVAPVAILAASIRIFSSFCFSDRKQLSQIMSPYSSSGLIKIKYICSKDFRSNLNFKHLIIFILVHAFSVI